MGIKKQATKDLANLNHSEPKRILHVIHEMRPEGVQSMVMNVYRHIDRSQIQFDFAVRSRQPEHYDEEIKSLGGKLFYLPWINDNPLSITAYIRGLETVLQEETFVGVHSHVGLFNGHILPLAKKVDIPLRIAHSHSTSAAKTSVLRTFWAIIMRRRIQVYATHLMACSSAAAGWLYGSQWEQDTRLTLIPNAIDIASYAEIHDDRIAWRQVTGLPLDSLLVGHIGRFHPVKNHAFLLNIFLAFHSLCPQAKLILIGEGALKEEIQRQAAEKGIEDSVYFLGVRSDIPQILGSLDLFVFPSVYEGLGIVLVEAQAAGVPCLVSDAIPVEADLGLGLVQFKSLDALTSEWAQALLKLESHKVPIWEKRKAALQDAGYDIHSSAKLLQDIYLTG